MPTPSSRLDHQILGIAYEILGSRNDSEQVVRDAWERRGLPADGAVDEDEAWLATLVANLSELRLQAQEIPPRAPGGQPSQQGGLRTPSPSRQELERVENISIAFITALERLSPEGRAALLLSRIFGTAHQDIAVILGRSKAECHRLVDQATAQLHGHWTQCQTKFDEDIPLLNKFADAARRGNLFSLRSLLDDQAILWNDIGGRVACLDAPLRGRESIANFYYATSLRYGSRVGTRVCPVGRKWGFMVFIDKMLVSVQTVTIERGKIVQIQAQRNAERLAAFASPTTT